MSALHHWWFKKNIEDESNSDKSFFLKKFKRTKTRIVIFEKRRACGEQIKKNLNYSYVKNIILFFYGNSSIIEDEKNDCFFSQ